jgi:hypothetical protein
MIIKKIAVIFALTFALTIGMAVVAAGRIIHIAHLKISPVEVAHYICRELGPHATRALRDALDQALAEPTITTEQTLLPDE